VSAAQIRIDKRVGKPLRRLLVEDSNDDELLILHALRRGGYAPLVTRTQSSRGSTNGLEQESPDVVISDHSIPGYGGLVADLMAARKVEAIERLSKVADLRTTTILKTMGRGTNGAMRLPAGRRGGPESCGRRLSSCRLLPPSVQACCEARLPEKGLLCEEGLLGNAGR
jgi:hypothetical protein